MINLGYQEVIQNSILQSIHLDSPFATREEDTIFCEKWSMRTQETEDHSEFGRRCPGLIQMWWACDGGETFLP